MSSLPPHLPDDAHASDDEDAVQLLLAAWALADFFQGEVIDEHGRRVPPPLPPSPSDEVTSDTSDTSDASEVIEENQPLELLPLYDEQHAFDRHNVQLNLFDLSSPAPDLVSLAQLRQWYKAAKASGRSPTDLQRIAALGQAFKQAYGANEPEVPHPFTEWTAEEIEQWRHDMGLSER